MLLGLAAPAAAQTIDSSELNEGQTKTFTVSGLPTSWTNGASVTITGGTGTNVANSCIQIFLDNSAPNWDICHDANANTFDSSTGVFTFQIRARGSDSDNADETFTAAIFQLGGSPTTSTTFTITIKEGTIATPPGLEFSLTSLTMSEGESDSYTVKLATEPTGPVTVTITGQSGTILTVDTNTSMMGDQATLTFTTMNWSVAQTVAVEADHDDDHTNTLVTLTHSASGADYGSVSGTLNVTISDDDTAALVFSPSTGVTVGEGATGSYTVKLATEPTGTVTVTISGQSGTDLTVDTNTGTMGNQDTLEFTATTWNVAQTVSLSAAEDDADFSNDSVTLTHSATGGSYLVTENVAVTIMDNDTATLSPQQIREGERVNFTISNLPSYDWFGFASADPPGSATEGPDYDFANIPPLSYPQTSFQFWLEAKTDSLNESDETIAFNVNLGTGPLGSGTVVLSYRVEITLKDVLADGIKVTPASLDLVENNVTNATKTYEVKLFTDPGANVTITATSADAGAVEVDTNPSTNALDSTLTFTHGSGGNWGTAQTVTVRAVGDSDGDDETVNITHAATVGNTNNPYHQIAIDPVVVSVTDDEGADYANVTVSPLSLNLTEGDATVHTYTVKLDSDPGTGKTVEVVVSIADDGSAFRADTNTNTAGTQSSLNFDSNNFSAAQTVSVWSRDDLDAESEVSSIRNFIRGTSAGDKYHNIDVDDVVVNVMDDDVGNSAGVFVSRTSIDLNDYYDQADIHKSTPYFLRLDTDPSAPVQITVTSSNVNAVKVDTDKHTGGYQSTLTFDSNDWYEIKEVRLTLVPDDDYNPETVTITHRASVSTDNNNPYHNIPIVSGTVNVIEYPEPKLLFNNLHCGEGDTEVIAKEVALRGPPPDQPVTVNMRVDPPTLGMLSTSTLTITPPNLLSASFTFTCSDDNISNPPHFWRSGKFIVTASSTGLYNEVTNEMNVWVFDDEDAYFDVYQGTTETVSLQIPLIQGRGDVIVDAASEDTTVMTVTPARHTWANPSDSNEFKSFTVTFLDTGNTQTVEEKLDFTPSANYHNPVVDRIYRIHPVLTDGVTITETGTPPATSVSEDGTTTDTYTVVLNTQPTDDVTVTVSAGTGTLVDGQDSGTAGAASKILTFRPSGNNLWSTAQTITVTGVNDSTDNPGGSRDVTITHTSTSTDTNYNSLTIADVDATVTDDDPTTVVLAGSPAGNVTEGGTKTLTLTLGRGLMDGETLNVPLTFATGAGNATRNTDYTLACPSPLPTGVTCNNLNSGNATVVFAGAAGQTTATVASLTLSATADSTAESGGETVNIGLGTLSHTGLDAGGVSGTDNLASFSIEDPLPDPVITISGGSAVTEGTAARFTLAANPAPSSNLDVSVTVEDAENGNFVGASDEGDRTVTIPANQGTHNFTVETTPDSNDEPSGPVTVTVNNGTGYTVGSTNSATTTVNDNDATTVTLAGPPGNVTEGNTKTITLTLNRGLVNGETLTVPLTFAGAAIRNTDYTLAETTATGVTYNNLNSGNATVIFAGAAGQTTATMSTITLTATDDGSTETTPETVNIGLGTLSHTGLDATSKTDNLKNFSIEDPPPDPTLSVTLSHAELNEGTTGDKTYATVTLNLNPSRSQATTFKACLKNTGTATRGNSADYQFVNASNDTPLTLGSDNCYTATINTTSTSQPVRLLIHGDTMEEPDETVVVELREAPTGVMISATAGSATFTIKNDDTPGLVFSPPSLRVAEGGTGRYTVRLATQPTEDVAVNIASGNPDVTVNPASLTFNASGGNLWSTAQTFTVSAAEDTDTAPDRATLTHTASGGGYNSITGTVVVTVTDNDGTRPPPPPPPVTPVVSLTGEEAISEGDEATFTLTATPAPATSLIVHVQVTQDGNFTTSSQTGTRSVSLGPDGTANLTVATVDDHEDEPDGSLTATIELGDGYSPHPTNDTASVAVTDNDDPPVTPEVAFASTAARAAENAGTQQVSVTLSPPPPTALTLTYTVGGTATAGAGNDYTLPPSDALAVAANQATVTIPVAFLDDHVAEDQETVILTLTDGTGYTVGSTRVHTLTITDNDTAGLRVSPSAIHLTEAGETATVTVHLTSQPTAPVTVTFTNPQARVATVAPANRTLPPGTWQIPQRVTVTAGADGFTILTVTVQSNDPVYAALARGALPRIRVRVGADLTALTTPWLARFGRTVTGQAVTGITSRLSAARTPGLTGTVAGLALDRLGDAPATEPGPTPAQLSPPPVEPPDPRLNPGGRLLNFRDLLAGSAFALTSDPSDTGGSYALWGQGAWTRFAGQAGAWNVDGDTLGGTLGVDWAQGPWVLGIAVSHTQGEGDSATTRHRGDLESSLTLVTPYLGVDVTEQVTLWGTLGYGRGTVTLTLPTEPEVETDTSLLLAAVGLRGQIREPASAQGLSLAVRSEARVLRTTAEAAASQGLSEVEADMVLLRLGMEGSWRQPLADGGSVVPRLDLGLRQDAGDAETGLGLEVSGGVRWEAPAHGLTLDLAGQTLVAHHDQEFETWGGAATVQWDPDPVSAAGPALTLRQTYGASGTGGANTFWTEKPVALLPTPGQADLRVTAEFGWGVPLQSGLGVPHVAYGWAPTSRELALGWRLLPTRATDVTLDLTATHREAVRTAPIQGVALSLTRTW